MFKHILVAVDGSESNKIAVDTAVALAKETGATLTALSVFDPGGYGNVVKIISKFFNTCFTFYIKNLIVNCNYKFNRIRCINF